MSKSPEEGKARDTPVHWYSVLRSVVDGYRQKTSVEHGVQKDAIQNAWDVRVDTNGSGWGFSFELVTGKGDTFFCMTDRGTTGLTGRVLKEEEYSEGLPPHERWAAFEGYGFTKEDVQKNNPLGSRGRGKFVFVGASQTQQILYDTLTVNGNYRFGAREIRPTKAPVIHYDEDNGRNRLRQVTSGAIEPLTTVGTRVVIVNPIPELVQAVQSGEFTSMVGETWWEIILKHNAQISVTVGNQTKLAEVPTEFLLPKKSAGSEKVWLRRGLKKTFGPVSFGVRTLHIVCSPGASVPEELRGIAIQRGGMKVCTIESISLPPHIRESMYGYVTFDEAGEKAIKDVEGLEHNDISYRTSFAKELRFWLQSEMTQFAKEELGYEPHPAKERREKQRAAERKALNAINRIAKVLGITRLGPIPRNHSPSGEGSVKPVRLVVLPPTFPNPGSKRVDYGQSIGDVQFVVVNDTKTAVRAKVKVFIRYDTEAGDTIDESISEIPPEDEITAFGPAKVVIDRKRFNMPGPYVLTAKLTDAETNAKVDQKGFMFYVETEPQPKGLFEDMSPLGVEEGEYAYSLAHVETSPSGGYVLNYNVAHPGYLAVEDDPDELAEHLFRTAAVETVRLDLDSDTPKIVDVDQEKLSDPSYLTERFSLAIGRILYYYHKGRS